MTKKYIGKRYVPKVMGEWNILTPYESLCVVTHNGASYTSKKDVPVGIDITNEKYWVLTGNYNAQVEGYRQEVQEVSSQLAEIPHTKELLSGISQLRFIAHRGYRMGVPENTIPSFEMAGELGYWGIECDIQTTSDGYWVIMHDLTVDKMTNGTGNVSDMTLSQIQSLIIDNGFNIAMYPNLKVPTFEDFLLVCKKYGCVPIIEIKAQTNPYTSKNLDDFISIVKKHGFEYNSVMITNNFTICTEVRNRNNNIVIQPLALITQSNLDFVKSLGNGGIDTDATKVTKDEVELAHSQGVLVNCFTPSTADDVQRLLNMGIDFITTDGVVRI